MGQKEQYRQYVEALAIENDTDRDQALAALLTPDFVAHDLKEVVPPGGVDSLKAFRRLVKCAFPDQVMVIEDLIEEGDRVVSRQTLTATHRGPYQGIPPTGARVSLELMEIVRFRQGRIAERWVTFDRGGLFTQLRRGE